MALVSVLIFAGCNSNQNGNANPPQNSKQDAGKSYELSQGDLVLFWGEGCPHCENVEKFLQDNKGLEEKSKLKKIEVFKDLNGQKLFLEKAKECGLASAGVPTLYKDGKCVQGDVPIIEELKKNL